MLGFLFTAGSGHGQKKAVGFFLYRKFWQKSKNNWIKIKSKNNIFLCGLGHKHKVVINYCRRVISSISVVFVKL